TSSRFGTLDNYLKHPGAVPMRILFAAAVAAVAIPALPAAAQSPRQEYRENVREAQRECARDMRRADNAREANRAQLECQRDMREARREYRRDRREAREDRREWRSDWRRYRNYDYNRVDPRYGGYYADRYYRDGGYYQPRQLAYNDRIYRGQDGRYYCRRDDGTTGLILGALGGGALGNIIAPGGSKTLGTVIGAVGGGIAGRALDRNGVTCR
ncbi:MAG TPA: hypothetical protein VGF45_02660, partial [Polyangia bacterium]